MFEKYSEKVFLKTCDCDRYGSWKPDAILEAMQEIAGAHTRVLNLGLSDLRKMGFAWIISRTKVVFDRVPRIGETIEVVTYPSAEMRLFFPRTHVFMDESGKEIGRAGALWLLMDLNTRKISVSEEVLKRMPENRGDMKFTVMPESVRPLETEAVVNEFEPPFSDYDINGHVNNTKYLQWCINAIGAKHLNASVIREFNVCYEAEISDDVTVKADLRCDGDRFTYSGEAEGKRRFSVSGVFGKR